MARQSDFSRIDRLPPWDEEAERAALSCILRDANPCMARAVLLLREGADSFYDLRHQHIYTACLYLHDHLQPIDAVIVADHLKVKLGPTEWPDVHTYLFTLPDLAVPSHFEEYCEIIRKKRMLRRIIATCTATVSSAYEVNGEAEEFLDRFESEALAVRPASEGLGGLVDIEAEARLLVDDYESAFTKGRPVGTLTGFRDLDRLAGGLMDQELVVIAGARSSGKTSLALNIAWNAALAGVPVGFLSLETSGKKLIHRLACAVGNYDGSRMLRGISTESDAPRVTAAFRRIKALSDRLFISQEGNLTPRQVAAKARRMQQSGARLFILDYLQLLDCPGFKEYDRATFASKAMKNLAKELNAPVIVLSSLNRDSEREERPPRLSDLRASGQIEYDADKVLLLHCEAEAGQDPENRVVKVNVAKNKDGPNGVCRLMFFASEFRLANCSSVGEDPPEQQILDEARAPYPDA